MFCFHIKNTWKIFVRTISFYSRWNWFQLQQLYKQREKNFFIILPNIRIVLNEHESAYNYYINFFIKETKTEWFFTS